MRPRCRALRLNGAGQDHEQEPARDAGRVDGVMGVLGSILVLFLSRDALIAPVSSDDYLFPPATMTVSAVNDLGKMRFRFFRGGVTQSVLIASWSV